MMYAGVFLILAVWAVWYIITPNKDKITDSFIGTRSYGLLDSAWVSREYRRSLTRQTNKRTKG